MSQSLFLNSLPSLHRSVVVVKESEFSFNTFRAHRRHPMPFRGCRRRQESCFRESNELRFLLNHFLMPTYIRSRTR